MSYPYRRASGLQRVEAGDEGGDAAVVVRGRRQPQGVEDVATCFCTVYSEAKRAALSISRPAGVIAPM
jgi:hypothetical protein